ncbi:M57 family metalloprotease [Kordia zhangzhouensis]|uniref:M57 family metalloprotease n=1 Tax=Kordia zhangzhouensis TaxID=1620405 RepID=UPI00069C8483|nr:M57 family metalloprotease [Kordia zhangzhouensis]
MKKIKYLLGVIAFLTIYSCSTDSVQINDENVLIEDQTELVFKEIKDLGFSEKDIVDMGSYFLVGNDITFSKTGRPQLANDDMTPKQRRTTYLVSDKTIGVRIDPSLPSNWKTATRNAMAHWNANSGSSIFLYETDYYWPYQGGFLFNPEIEVMNDNAAPLPNNTIAAAEFPTSNGMPGYRIRINLSFSGCSVSNNLRFYNMIHEFGHCLTFAHTNSSFGSHISGTPTSDSNSVMNGGTACTLSSGLSTGDRTAVNTLYPLQINAPTNVQAYHDGDEELTMTWNAVPGATSYKIYNNIKETGKTGWYHYRTSSSTSYSRELKLSYRNGYRMMVTAVDANGNESKMVEANYNW